MKKTYCLTRISLFVICWIGLGAGVAEASNMEVTSFYPTQHVCGKSLEMTVGGTGFSAISAVEITPADHLQVGEMIEIESTEEGEKRWSVVILTEQEAQAGERNVVLVTPEGRTAPQTINVVPYAPEITELKILSTEQENCRVNLLLSIAYEDAELDTESPIETLFLCATGGGMYDMTQMTQTLTNLAQKGPGQYELEHSFEKSGYSCSGRCGLSITIKDGNGYQGSSTTRVDFSTSQ